MSKQIIEAYSRRIFDLDKSNGEYLNVSEFYYDTIQGEGINTGVPAAFLRLKMCRLNCVFCDTTEVWRTGQSYSFKELIKMIEDSPLLDKLKNGQHLIITGGSPLLQQHRLVGFIQSFINYFGFKPIIEMENECSIFPLEELVWFVQTWNNSPKLENSEVDVRLRYQPDILRFMSRLPDSWFKFVITKESDWTEIEKNYLEPKLIERNQIILMPEGATRAEIARTQQMTVDLAIQNSVRYCSREHIVLWDKKTGT